VVTGASSGIGAATARALAKDGFSVVIGARRLDRLRTVAEPIGARALPLDVTDQASVDAFVADIHEARVLVNNAGGALGREPIERADLETWLRMYEMNFLGTVRVTKALLPALERSGDGHVVIIGSVAALEAYEGGAGYTGAKHAERILSETLRLELVGRPIRITEVDPGLVETEFSLVRFSGDEKKARAVYAGMTPLTAEDVADCIAFAVTRPSHVNIDQIVVKPRDQATAAVIHRLTD